MDAHFEIAAHLVQTTEKRDRWWGWTVRLRRKYWRSRRHGPTRPGWCCRFPKSRRSAIYPFAGLRSALLPIYVKYGSVTNGAWNAVWEDQGQDLRANVRRRRRNSHIGSRAM